MRLWLARLGVAAMAASIVLGSGGVASAQTVGGPGDGTTHRCVQAANIGPNGAVPDCYFFVLPQAVGGNVDPQTTRQTIQGIAQRHGLEIPWSMPEAGVFWAQVSADRLQPLLTDPSIAIIMPYCFSIQPCAAPLRTS